MKRVIYLAILATSLLVTTGSAPADPSEPMDCPIAQSMIDTVAMLQCTDDLAFKKDQIAGGEYIRVLYVTTTGEDGTHGCLLMQLNGLTNMAAMYWGINGCINPYGDEDTKGLMWVSPEQMKDCAFLQKIIMKDLRQLPACADLW